MVSGLWSLVSDQWSLLTINLLLKINVQVCDNCQLDFLCVDNKCSIMNYEKCQVRL